MEKIIVGLGAVILAICTVGYAVRWYRRYRERGRRERIKLVKIRKEQLKKLESVEKLSKNFLEKHRVRK